MQYFRRGLDLTKDCIWKNNKQTTEQPVNTIWWLNHCIIVTKQNKMPYYRKKTKWNTLKQPELLGTHKRFYEEPLLLLTIISPLHSSAEIKH